MVQVIKPTLEHAKQLANNLRQIDILELKATNPDRTPEKVLTMSYHASVKSYAIVEEGECLGMFGVVPVTNTIGVPWLLSTDKFFEQHSTKFARQCRAYLQEMAEGFGYLTNYIAADNKKCQHWLKWLGFTIYEEYPVDFNGTPFYMFDMRIK